MLLQYCSDLHLEFPENRKFIKRHALQPKGEILLLAGDIIPFALMEEANDFLDLISDTFGLVYWVPGNHEYYSSDIGSRSGVLHEKIRDNVFLVNNISLQQNGITLIFSTLWSRISAINEWTVQRSISDFHAIRSNGNRFGVSDFNNLFMDSLSFLHGELDKLPPIGGIEKDDRPARPDDEGKIIQTIQSGQSGKTGKTVVVSHHVPTYLNYPEWYRNSPLSEAFATELYDLIESSPIDHWIYGHHHNNTPDFTIGHTCLHTNQLGYVKNREHHLFRLDKLIEV